MCRCLRGGDELEHIAVRVLDIGIPVTIFFMYSGALQDVEALLAESLSSSVDVFRAPHEKCHVANTAPLAEVLRRGIVHLVEANVMIEGVRCLAFVPEVEKDHVSLEAPGRGHTEAVAIEMLRAVEVRYVDDDVSHALGSGHGSLRLWCDIYDSGRGRGLALRS
jgi:hypothetical protein